MPFLYCIVNVKEMYSKLGLYPQTCLKTFSFSPGRGGGGDFVNPVCSGHSIVWKLVVLSETLSFREAGERGLSTPEFAVGRAEAEYLVTTK